MHPHHSQRLKVDNCTHWFGCWQLNYLYCLKKLLCLILSQLTWRLYLLDPHLRTLISLINSFSCNLEVNMYWITISIKRLCYFSVLWNKGFGGSLTQKLIKQTLNCHRCVEEKSGGGTGSLFLHTFTLSFVSGLRCSVNINVMSLC